MPPCAGQLSVGAAKSAWHMSTDCERVLLRRERGKSKGEVADIALQVVSESFLLAGIASRYGCKETSLSLSLSLSLLGLPSMFSLALYVVQQSLADLVSLLLARYLSLGAYFA